MTPLEFHDEVAQPNMEHALRHPDDVRALVNAVLTLDALAGLVHAHGRAAGVPAMVKHDQDDRYRYDLAAVSRSYRVLRDLAASLKHGALDPKRAKARLVRSGEAVRSVRNQCGLFQCGDSLGGDVLVGPVTAKLCKMAIWFRVSGYPVSVLPWRGSGSGHEAAVVCGRTRRTLDASAR